MRNIEKIPVDEYTTPSPLSVEQEATLREVKALMADHDVRHVPVTSNGVPVGIISDRDLIVASRFETSDTQLAAKDVMTPEPYTVLPETSIDEVVFNMSAKKFGSSLVQYENGEFGIFTSTDALNALIEVLRNQAN